MPTAAAYRRKTGGYRALPRTRTCCRPAPRSCLHRSTMVPACIDGPGPRKSSVRDVEPRFFRSGAEMRRWLERNHQTASELLVGFYRRATGRPSLTWAESVDEALCFGWIDGIRKPL